MPTFQKIIAKKFKKSFTKHHAKKMFGAKWHGRLTQLYAVSVKWFKGVYVQLPAVWL